MVSYRPWGLRTAGLALAIVVAGSGCGGDDDDSGTGGKGGKGGSAGSAGSAHAGKGGTAQAGNAGRSSGGSSGSSASGGTAGGGAGNAGGSAGTVSGGSGGTAGTVSGNGGTAGGGAGGTTAGTSGTGGTVAGTGGTDNPGGSGGESGLGGQGGEGGAPVGASGAGGSPEPDAICGNNVVEPGEDCDSTNTDNLDGCNSKCQNEVNAGPGLALAIVDNGYTGTLASMACVDLVVASKGDGQVDAVSVRVGLTHTFVGDLVLKLVAPDNTVVTLASRPGDVEPADDGMGSGGDNSNLASAFPISFVTGGPKSAESMGNTISDTQTICQDDTACVYTPANGAAAAGTLASFNGKTAAGTWRFCAGDALTGDTGTIDSVRLSVVQ